MLSIYAGLRPLVKHGDAKNTAVLSRDHTILISDSGLITITGGKWTTYRKMAEDVVNRAEEVAATRQTSLRDGDAAAAWLDHGAARDRCIGMFMEPMPPPSAT